MSFQRTFAIIKPDVFAKGSTEKLSKILDIIKQNNLNVEKHEQTRLSKELAEKFYGEHKGKFFYQRLVNFMTSGPCMLMVLSGENAVSKWRFIMGPTHLKKAKSFSEYPNNIRALFAESDTRNTVHGSDSVDTAKREISFFFPNEKV